MFLLSRITLLFVIILLMPTLAHAEIATVDVKMILEKSQATQKIRDQIKSRRDTLQKKVNEQEEDLRNNDQELAKQRSILAKEAFEEKAKEFREKVAAAQRDIQEKNAKLENAYANALAVVQKNVQDIIAGLAKDKGFSAALPKSQVLYAKDSLDISGEVLKQLDKRLPTVNVVVE